jgi:ActR/RegA family two-component response regulator
MRSSAAVLCRDPASLEMLNSALREMGLRMVACPSRQEALELVVGGRCSTLIVDFDLPGAEEVIRMAALLPKRQKPALLAVASRAWPGTGEAFHSGASRILYRPLDAEQVKGALRSGRRPSRKTLRRATRYQMKALVYLEVEKRTLPAISIDISEHGMAVQAAEPVPITSNLTFRCVLPGTNATLEGHAEVIWASDHGRAGMFFSQLSPEALKRLRHWLSRRAHSDHKKHAHALLPTGEDHVCFAAVSE